MTNETLATASNYTLYAALAFLALAMVGFALHLAVQGATATHRARRPEAVPVSPAASASAPALRATTTR